MSNSSKIIIAILDFFICAFIGYMGMNLLSRPKGPSSEGVVSQAQGGGPSASHGRAGSRVSPPAATLPGTSTGESVAQQPQTPVAPASPANTPPDLSSSPMPSPGTIPTEVTSLQTGMVSSPEVLEVSAPRYDGNSNTYSFKVTANGVNLTYTVADSKKKDLQSNQTGDFYVQPAASGKYYVYVTDSYGNKSEYREVKGFYRPVNKVTKDELQQILNSGRSQNAIDADFTNRVSSGCRYEFVGINEDEDAPKSYNEILNRIRMKTWSSVTVLSVAYNNETNKLVRARIQVNY